MLPLAYVLPYRSDDSALEPELVAYLAWLVDVVECVVVVDGSDGEVFGAHGRALPGAVVHVPPEERTPMGKVGGVLTGVRLATCDKVVVADDDVRYDQRSLARVGALLDGAEVVRPANAFQPLPWHARIDTGRILLNRAAGGDWPGTLAVRRSVLLGAGGYRGDVLFENLELVRTVRAAGGREVLAQDVIVVRRPATTRHHLGQRVRQAYDELARPARLAWQLALLPGVAGLVAARRHRLLAGLVLGAMAVAEVGRRRDGGRAAFPASSSLLAPVWLAERAVCSWAAVGARLRGGVRYRDGRLRTAASGRRELAARVAAARATSSPPAPGAGGR